MIVPILAGLMAGYGDKKEMEYQEERERQAGEAARAKELEQRAYEEDWYFRKTREERLTKALPVIMERRSQSNAVAAEREQYGKFFNDRLGESVPEGVRTAFTNLAVEQPEYAKGLYKKITELDSEGRRLTGPQIIKMSRLFESTKPEDTSLEEWIAQASSKVTMDQNGIDFDTTLQKLISGDISDEELLEAQFGGTTAPAGLGILPDFDTSAVVGPDPARRMALRKDLTETFKVRLAEELSALESFAAKERDEGRVVDDAVVKRLQELQALTLGTDPDSKIFSYYAPKTLPALAVDNPELKLSFPEYFEVKYSYDENGKLVISE